MELNSKYRVCTIGIGFVGLTLSLFLTELGIQVYAVDKNEELIETLKAGKTKIRETNIENLLQDAITKKRIVFLNSDDNLSEIENCNVFIITVGTPLHNGEVNLSFISDAVMQVLPYIPENAIVILRSTTLVGTANEVVKPLLASRFETIKLAMCPERTVEGEALEEIRNLPQIIGADDDDSFNAAKNFFLDMGVQVVKVDSLKAAELTKLVNNTYRDLMFGFANEIAKFSHKCGVSSKQIIEAANLNYPRSNIALPGPSGGPCLEKDPWILYESAVRHGIDMQITRASRKTNETSVIDLISSCLGNIYKIDNLGILGLSFKGKPITHDSRGSFAPKVIEFFQVHFPSVNVTGFEPSGIFESDFKNIIQANGLSQALNNQDCLVILTNSSEFYGIESQINELVKSDCYVIDFWGILNPHLLNSGIRYDTWY